MNNLYLFIIWNNALFCKDKIYKDINDSFIIKNSFYVKWDKKLFNNNSKALYGTKIGNSKHNYKGNGIFYCILVEDNTNVLEKRKDYDGFNNVNIKVYEKKQLYRKWTGDNFRVHCSLNSEETNHDLIILFGKEYLSIINSIKKDDIYEKNTSGLKNFKNYDEFKDAIQLLFINSIVKKRNDEIFIYANCRVNVLFYINKLETNINKISIDNKNYKLYVFGELEGDIPNNFLENANNNSNIITEMINNNDAYLLFLNDRSNNSVVKEICQKFSLNLNYNSNNTIRTESNSSFFKYIKNMIKYYFKRIQYIINK